MNTHTIATRTLWAIVAMEVGLALPLISLPTQGDRLIGPAGPVLLVLLLPLGYASVCRFAGLRDPSWRLLTGIALALATRAVVSVVPEPGPAGLLVWFAHSVIPLSIGVALWWRGAGLSVAEFTAADVRTEFGVLAICLIGALAMVRPFLLPDPQLLGASVGIFAVGGLIAIVLSRQDAAELSPVPFGRLLGAASAILPALAAVLLVSMLRPSLLGSMWMLVGRLIELAFTPIGWFVAWLASLFPQGPPPPTTTPTRQPRPDLTPDPAALAQLEERIGWIGYVVLFTLIICGALVAILLVRVMLENWLRAPQSDRDRNAEHDDVRAEATGDPGEDAQDLLGWLRQWLRARLGRDRQAAVATTRAPEEDAADAWAAYKRLLDWARRQGIGRRPPETARELEIRLTDRAPEAGDAIALVTETFEADRYGGVAPPGDRLRRLREALASLSDR